MDFSLLCFFHFVFCLSWKSSQEVFYLWELYSGLLNNDSILSFECCCLLELKAIFEHTPTMATFYKFLMKNN
jgi:hypothetical protein